MILVIGKNRDHLEQDEFFEKYIKPMRPDGFRLHHTPDYSKLKRAKGQPYKYMNKRMLS